MEPSSTTETASAKRKLLVLGATGGTGRHIVSRALARGFDVTVLARTAGKAASLGAAQVAVGVPLDEAALRRPLEGRDAVTSALGT